MTFLLNNFVELTVTGLVARLHLRARRARLHAGLRRAAADQLRPLRGLHVRHASRRCGRSMLGIGAGDSGIGLVASSACSLLALVAAMVASAAPRAGCSSASPTAAAQARTPRRWSSLISAIGASLRARRDHGPARQARGFVGSRRPRRVRPRRPRQHRFPTRSSQDAVHVRRLHASATSTCWSSSRAMVMMVALDQFVRRARLGRGIRAVAQDPETAALMGVNIDRVDPLDVPARRRHGRRGGLLFMHPVRGHPVRHRLHPRHQGVHRRRARRHRQPARRPARWPLLGLVENYGSAVFGTEWKDVVAFVVLVVVLMFRPTGLLGESLGRARA